MRQRLPVRKPKQQLRRQRKLPKQKSPGKTIKEALQAQIQEVMELVQKLRTKMRMSSL